MLFYLLEEEAKAPESPLFRHRLGPANFVLLALALTVSGSPKWRGKIMVKTYRDVAIEQMIATVEEAMSQVIEWWGDLPAPMKEAICQKGTR